MLRHVFFAITLFGAALSNPVLTQDFPAATIVAREPVEVPPAPPANPAPTDAQIWLEYSKTFNPMAPTTPAPETPVDQIYSFEQTTYYTCVTYSLGGEHCGWHIPILKVSAADQSGTPRQAGVKAAAAASLVLAALALA